MAAAAWWTAAALLAGPVAAQESDGADACEGGRISEIEIRNGSIFDPEEAESGWIRWAYGAANALHMRTRPGFIRGELLFREGDCLDPFLLEESARLLRGHGFIGQAGVATEALADGSTRVVVSTRDEWSTQFDLGVSYDDGLNFEKLELTEENFLGMGLRASGTRRARREREDLALRVGTPRFFGRADANFEWGRARAGHFAKQWVTYPFVGETGRTALRQFFARERSFFPFATGGNEPFSHVLVPVLDERIDLSAARRFGEPGRLVVVGVSLTRDVLRFHRPPEVARDNDFEGAVPATAEQAASVATQLVPRSATRVALLAGIRRVSHRRFRGLDALRGDTDVQLGLDAGVTIGRSVDVLTPQSAPRSEDLFTRLEVTTGAQAGGSIVLGNAMLESRRVAGRWLDVLAEADVFAYGRAEWLPSQTLFARVSATGGWKTTAPYQLTLGGRDGIRSLAEDAFPAGRRILFTVEDRIVFGWPRGEFGDFGATLFADAGRAWAGDVPYGGDTGWFGAVGAGLRMGFPSGTRNTIRMDLAFPIGTGDGTPLFRVTLFERHGLRVGFSEDQLKRSRRFHLGPAQLR